MKVHVEEGYFFYYCCFKAHYSDNYNLQFNIVLPKLKKKLNVKNQQEN